ncbi:MAG: formylglycine-generating enzyme family protein [Planctomycetales bacterium]
MHVRVCGSPGQASALGHPVYACRAGTTTAYSFGNDPGALKDYAWFGENTLDTWPAHPVGLKRPNAYGLRDMYGNVWEWCEDWFGVYSREAVTDPVRSTSFGSRVYRGGGRICAAEACRSAYRYGLGDKSRFHGLGFRVVAV